MKNCFVNILENQPDDILSNTTSNIPERDEKMKID